MCDSNVCGYSDNSESESDSECNGFEIECCLSSNNADVLPFDPTSIENIILMISDKIDLRILMKNEKTRGAVILTAGLAIAGGLLGKYYHGNLGMAVGGVAGGAVGVGIVAVTMRSAWEDIKSKLSELYEIVYDYLAGLGIDDYKKAAMFVANQGGVSTQLALLVFNHVSGVLEDKVVSNLAAGALGL